MEFRLSGDGQGRARNALASRLAELIGRDKLDDGGYLIDPQTGSRPTSEADVRRVLRSNVIAPVSDALLHEALGQVAGGAGSELKEKILAAYSSAALALNTFAAFIDQSSYVMPGLVKLERPCLEGKLPTREGAKRRSRCALAGRSITASCRTGWRASAPRRACSWTARGEEMPSIHQYMVTLRAKLLAEGVLVPDGSTASLRCSKDFLFGSPSTAAGVVRSPRLERPAQPGCCECGAGDSSRDLSCHEPEA